MNLFKIVSLEMELSVMAPSDRVSPSSPIELREVNNLTIKRIRENRDRKSVPHSPFNQRYSRRMSGVTTIYPDPLPSFRLKNDKRFQFVCVDEMGKAAQEPSKIRKSEQTLRKGTRIELVQCIDSCDTIIPFQFVLVQYEKDRGFLSSLIKPNDFRGKKLGVVLEYDLMGLLPKGLKRFYASNYKPLTQKELDQLHEKPKPEDVKQSVFLGDCYWLASVAAVIAKKPEKISEIITVLPEHIQVQFPRTEPFYMARTLRSRPSFFRPFFKHFTHESVRSAPKVRFLEKAKAIYNCRQGKSASAKMTNLDGGHPYEVLPLLTGENYESKQPLDLRSSIPEVWRKGKTAFIAVYPKSNLCFFPEIMDCFTDNQVHQAVKEYVLDENEKKVLLSLCYQQCLEKRNGQTYFNPKDVALDVKQIIEKCNAFINAKKRLLILLKQAQDTNQVQLLEKMIENYNLVCQTMIKLQPVLNKGETYTISKTQFTHLVLYPGYAYSLEALSCFHALSEYNDHPVVASTGDMEGQSVKEKLKYAMKLFGNHSYTVMGTKVTEKGLYVRLRNPLGLFNKHFTEFDVAIDDFVRYFEDVAIPVENVLREDSDDASDRAELGI